MRLCEKLQFFFVIMHGCLDVHRYECVCILRMRLVYVGVDEFLATQLLWIVGYAFSSGTQTE